MILPYVYKTEQTTSSTNSFENSSSGLGDISTIIQYSVFTNDQFYSIIGGGLKWATGATQKVDKVSQLLQQPSLQPGTGSNDYLFLSLFNWSLPFRKSLSAQQVFSYQLTGISKRFASHESYKFGNELQSFTAVSDQFHCILK